MSFGMMDWTYREIFVFAIVCLFTQVLGQGIQNCSVHGDYFGAIVRKKDFDFRYDIHNDTYANLSLYEIPPNMKNIEVVLDEDYYTTTCLCGIVTMWQFYAWHPGNVTFYVYNPNKQIIVDSSTFTINKQSEFNFFEIPISSDRWIPIQKGYRIGFYCQGENITNGPGEPMIPYGDVTGSPEDHANGYYEVDRKKLSANDPMLMSGQYSTKNKRFPVAAFVIPAHLPMFVNGNFMTTLYTHQNGSGEPIFKPSVLDLDGVDEPTVKLGTIDPPAPGVFSLTGTFPDFKLYYDTPTTAGTYEIEIIAADECPYHPNSGSVSMTVTVNLIYEPPRINDLPASKMIDEFPTVGDVLHQFAPSVASNYSMSCQTEPPTVNIFTLDPTMFKGDGTNYVNITLTSQISDYDTATHYDINISCKDIFTSATVYSNFQVYVEKNKEPYFDPAGDGYLPAHVSIDRSPDPDNQNFFTVSMVDELKETVTVKSFGCTPACPYFDVDLVTGQISRNTTELPDDGPYGFNLEIEIEDSNSKTDKQTLSISISGRNYTYNSEVYFSNLPHTLYVMENTAIGTTLFKVMYSDENPDDVFTFNKTSANEADSYFKFDTTTRLITVESSPDYEMLTADSWEMTFEVIDGSFPQHNQTATGTLTITVVNINEGVQFDVSPKTFTAVETATTLTGTSTYTITHEDGYTDHFISMDCGEDSKYFKLVDLPTGTTTTTSSGTITLEFARDYDMDSGLSGSATCTVKVRDKDGNSDNDTITIMINNANDNSPKFPHHNYVFILDTTTPFFTEIANMSASDADSDSNGSTNGVLTYSFDPVSPTDEYFQIDAAGILYVRNLTTFAHNSYVFSIKAEDSGTRTGTCTVTVVFRGMATTTTTTTERSLVFADDYQNYFWLLLISLAVVATFIIIGLMIWFDPVIHEKMSFKLLRLSEWCRKKPKPKVPRRHVGRLKVTVNDKQLENDPDNALPWELLAKDADVPEMNEIQEDIQRRKEKKDREYKDFAGLPVFERGRGARPDSGRATADSTGTRDSDSPKYATFQPPPDDLDDA